MFRDPTKWYMLIAVTFSILIPYALHTISLSIFKKAKYFKIIFFVFFLLLWAVLVREAFDGTIKGTFSSRIIPQNYQALADTISSDSTFFRTLWIPKYQTFAYVSNTHPAVPAAEFFNSTSSADLLDVLSKSDSEKILQDASIKYVIVPEDIEGKIFLEDRKYDEKIYKSTLEGVDRINYLTKVNGYGRIGVYEVESFKGHFWSNNPSIKITDTYISPTEYEVVVENAQNGDEIIFTESFDKFWNANIDGRLATSMPYVLFEDKNLNSFKLPKSGKYSIKVYYQPQEWLRIGSSISITSLIVVISIFFRLRKK